MKIAVAVHCHYPNVFKEIICSLNNLHMAVDLYVTSTCDFTHSDNKDIKYIAFDKVENRGMDVLPFLYTVNKYQLWKYDLVIKLHTKNDLTQYAINMMKIYIETLLTDDAITSIILSIKSQDSIGIWGALPFARYIDKLMYGNRKKFNELKHLIGIHHPEKKIMFFSGTMFCIKGDLLKLLSNKYIEINNSITLEKTTISTGNDGDYAHSLERIFPILVKSQSHNIGVICPREFSVTNKYLIFIDYKFSNNNYEHIFQSGSNDTSGRWLKLSHYMKLNYSPIVDFDKYSKVLSLKKEEDINYKAHYLFFCDYINQVNLFENNFSSSLYRLVRLDVFRAGIPSAFHYLSRGKKEHPEYFTGEWGKELVNDVLPKKIFINDFDKNINFREAIKNLGDTLIIKRNTGSYYNSISFPLQSFSASIITIIEEYVFNILHARDILTRQIQHQDFTGALATAKNVSSKSILTPEIAEILAVGYTLTQEWELATRYWTIYQNSVNNSIYLLSMKSRRLIKYDIDYDPTTIFFCKTTFHTEKSIVDINITKKICIYTSLFGDYDDLPELKTDIPKGIQLLAFTDKYHTNADKKWKQIVLNPSKETNNLSAKEFKILPHKYLTEYDYSLFVDANTVFTGNLHQLISLLIASGKFTMFRHPKRTDLLKEACAIISSCRAIPSVIIKQVSSYFKEGIPIDSGLCEGSFIWRKHNDKQIINFMNTWYSHIEMYSHRDQLSLCFLMWKNSFYPKLLDDYFGTSRKNIFFYKDLHKVEK